MPAWSNLYFNIVRHNPLGGGSSRDFGFREYLPFGGRSPPYNGQPHPVAWRRGQPEKRDCARSEWPDVGDSLLLVGQEQGSDEQPGRERRPRQSAVGYAGERIRKHCVLD